MLWRSHHPSRRKSLRLTSASFAPGGSTRKGERSMKRFSSRQRDDAFGQSMLALRTSLGLTQAELAHRLGVSGRAVRQWEAGLSYPKAEHLQQVMTLAVRASAFPPGREAEEIRALWKAA